MSQSFKRDFELLLEDYCEELEEILDNNVDEASEYLKGKYEDYSRKKKWNDYAKHFAISKYKSKHSSYKKGLTKNNYIGNSLATKDKNKIPLINLLTYGATRKNRGVMQSDDHIDRIFNKEINNIEKIIGGK